MNMYILDDPTLDYAEFYEFRVKKEGDDSFALIEQFASAKQLEGGKLHYTSDFGRYEYKDDKAFGGMVYDENGNTVDRISAIHEYQLFYNPRGLL